VEMDTNDGQSKTSPSQLPLAANKTSKPRPRHHYLVVQTKRTLLAQKPDEHGMLWGGGQACLNVAVSKEPCDGRWAFWTV
jgi:hypothetical protein